MTFKAIKEALLVFLVAFGLMTGTFLTIGAMIYVSDTFGTYARISCAFAGEGRMRSRLMRLEDGRKAYVNSVGQLVYIKKGDSCRISLKGKSTWYH